MQAQGSVRVLIADNQPVLREGLHSVLSLHPDLQPVGEATTESEVVEQCRRLQPDVIVVDCSLSVHIVVSDIQKTEVACKVVVLAEAIEAQAVYTYIYLGIDGIVSLTDPPEKIVEAIRMVANGSKYLPGMILDH